MKFSPLFFAATLFGLATAHSREVFADTFDYDANSAAGEFIAQGWTTENGTVGTNLGTTAGGNLWGHSTHGGNTKASLEYNYPTALAAESVITIDATVSRTNRPYEMRIWLWDGTDAGTRTQAAESLQNPRAKPLDTLSYTVTPDDIAAGLDHVIFEYGHGAGWGETEDISFGVTMDSDHDGLDDSVETDTRIYISPDDTGSDPNNPDTDGDGVDDGVEVAHGSDPNTDDDTDGDGVFNLAETTGSLNGAYSNEPTDPLDPDSDADSLSDGDELTVHHSNPNALDSDGDGFTDPGEILGGSDPNSPDSVPAGGTSDRILINFVGGQSPTNGGFIDTATTTTHDDTAGISPTNGWNNLRGTDQFRVGVLDADGVTISTNILVAGVPNTWSLDGAIDNSPLGVGFPHDGNASLMQGYLDTGVSSTTSVEVYDITFPTYDVIVYIDGGLAGRFGDYTVNGETLATVEHGVGWDIQNGGGTFVRHYAPGQAQPGNYIVFHGMTDPLMTLTATPNGGFRSPVQGVEILNSGPDGDGDGIPDNTESVILGTNPVVSDIGIDNDGDGIDNVQEFQDRTDIDNPDTDNDGLNDGSESIGGTDPLNPDTDGDGFMDGAEDANGNGVVDPGETDPNNADTDGDTVIDSVDDEPLNNNNDQDGDGIGNNDELTGVFNVNFANEPTEVLEPDTDGDGLDDLADINAGADPNNPDTDADSLEDSYEVNVSSTSPSDPGDPGVVARAIGINVVTDQNPTATLGLAEIAGFPDYLQAGWNNTRADKILDGTEFNIETPNAGVLTDSNGVILTDDGTAAGNPTTTMAWDTITRWSTNNGTGNANSKLMLSYWDAGTTITFAGIPYAYYDVVVYVGSDGNGRDGVVALFDGASTQLAQAGYNSTAAHGGFQAADYILGTDVTGTAFPPANVVVFPAVSGADLVIENQLQGINTGIMAVQLVETTAPADELKITAFTRTSPTTFEIDWIGGDGTNDIEASTDAVHWNPILTDVASPQSVTADPATASPRFFRVVEP